MIWPAICLFIQGDQGIPALPAGNATWIERAIWIIFVLGLVGERIHNYRKSAKGEQHQTDLAHIASLKDVNITLRALCDENKREIEGLKSAYEQAKKELTALALIEIGKLLNFAGMKRDLDSALEENSGLRRELAQRRVVDEESVVRKSGEYRMSGEYGRERKHERDQR